MRLGPAFRRRLILLSRKTPRPFRNSSCPDAIVAPVVRCLSEPKPSNRVSASAFAPPPASHGTPGGGFIRVVPCVALAHGAD